MTDSIRFDTFLTSALIEPLGVSCASLVICPGTAVPAHRVLLVQRHHCLNQHLPCVVAN